jgi:sarcosine oxidase delta subunit
MLKIKTEFKLSQIKQIQEAVGSKKIRSVANKAINKTVDKAQRFIDKEIINKQGLVVSQAAVSRSQDKKKSTVKSLGAVVIIRKKKQDSVEGIWSKAKCVRRFLQDTQAERTKADSWWVYS